ncbi:C40 family peptidase [Nocardia sp. 2]|uniref:C40 family peptidase n=1 Tax=Nocardia acididurans TaxID=2802282 RepID=A0ABS1MGQ9_9NOCA|nr:NlpC/P60 family protein [Nocardia acididurans]MBL1079769.1 C40 family peptidase [Nocardia acididurans]
MTDFETDTEKSLRALLGLYGASGPSEAGSPLVMPVMPGLSGAAELFASRAYAEVVSEQGAEIASLSSHDGFVHSVVTNAAAGTALGRKVVDDHLAEFRSRLQAIAAIAHPAIRSVALMDSAQTLLQGASQQVNRDAAAAQQQASRITAPVAPARRTRSRRPVRRRGSRSRGVRVNANTTSRRAVTGDRTAGSAAVRAADHFVGLPYVWGGGGANGPSGGGFDCSGLTQYAIARASNGEVILPRTTYDQINTGVAVHPRDVRPGDLVFPGSSFSGRGPEHVQLAAGGGWVIEAPYTGSTVKWTPMSPDAVVRRVL